MNNFNTFSILISSLLIIACSHQEVKEDLVEKIFPIDSYNESTANQTKGHDQKRAKIKNIKNDNVKMSKMPLISNVRQITFQGRRAGEGYFSPDGTKMIFQSERHPGNPFYQIYIMDMLTGKTSLVSTGKGKTTCAWIHPSQKKVLYSSTHLDPNTLKNQHAEYKQRESEQQKKYSWSYDPYYDIFEATIEGGNLKQLTSSLGYDAEGSYSPDGRFIVFASNRSGYDGTLNLLSEEDKKLFFKDQSYLMDIYIMDANGQNLKRLTDEKGYDGGPFFSADGSKLTWRHFSADGKTAEIWTMDIDGSNKTQISNLQAMSWAPFFHPSGDYIIFTTNLHGYSNFELYIAATNGSKEVVRVTYQDGFDGLPVFTPDGRHLSWTRKESNQHGQIFYSSWNDQLARNLLGLPPKAPEIKTLSKEIDRIDLQKYIYYLASEQMQGRPTGGPEQKESLEHLASLWQAMGVAPAGEDGSYFAPFEFVSDVTIEGPNTLSFSAPLTAQIKKDWIPLSFSTSKKIPSSKIVFVGYGMVVPSTDKFAAYDSYQGVNLQGKWALAFNYIPENLSIDYKQHLNLYSMPWHKAMIAREHGAVGIILVNGPSSNTRPNLEAVSFKSGPVDTSSIAAILISDELAEEMMSFTSSNNKDLTSLQKKLDKGEELRPIDLDLSLMADINLKTSKSIGLNLLGKLTSKKKNAANILIGTHSDHLGKGKSSTSLMKYTDITDIHFGADDNASGVAAVMELAHYFAGHQKDLESNLTFALWSGEEIGILGSNHYVKSMTNLPDVVINLDMIGRKREKLIVQATASAKEWGSVLEEAAVQTKMNLTTQENPYVPSDALSFYLKEVPVVSLFTGAHRDYHSPRDTANKLNYQGLKEITDFTKSLVDILSGKVPLTYMKVKKGNQQKRNSFRVYLGTIPDYSQKEVQGVRLSGVSAGGPAEKAGVKGEDIIIHLAGKKIENLYDYVYVLQALKPNQSVTMKLLRNNEQISVTITPEAKK